MEKQVSDIENLKDPKDKGMKLGKLIYRRRIAASQAEEVIDNLWKSLGQASDKAARVYTENLIKQEILNKIQENEREYLNQIKLQVIKTFL